MDELINQFAKILIFVGLCVISGDIFVCGVGVGMQNSVLNDGEEGWWCGFLACISLVVGLGVDGFVVFRGWFSYEPELFFAFPFCFAFEVVVVMFFQIVVCHEMSIIKFYVWVCVVRFYMFMGVWDVCCKISVFCSFSKILRNGVWWFVGLKADLGGWEIYFGCWCG